MTKRRPCIIGGVKVDFVLDLAAVAGPRQFHGGFETAGGVQCQWIKLSLNEAVRTSRWMQMLKESLKRTVHKDGDSSPCDVIVAYGENTHSKQVEVAGGLV